jgi:choline dehydrogenase-like flavoprotein
MVAEAIARKWFDASITSDADRRDVYLVDSMIEQRPNRTNRISLSSERDRLGLPRVEIQWRLAEADKDSLWRSCELLGRGLGASGAGRLRVLGDQEGRTWDDLLNFGHHHMGTTRMHDDPKHGVVDKHLRVHGIHNLYVVGSSVFPTGGHVPPTLTIVALAVRLAEHLRATVRV